MALCPASYQFMRRAAKGGSLKDQSFVIGAANDGGEPIVFSNLSICFLTLRFLTSEVALVLFELTGS